MKRTLLNMYDLHKKVILWERYEKRRAIIKYLNRAKNQHTGAKLAAKLKR